MQDYVVNRPEVGAMEQILEKNFDNAAGAILRLAWQAGLLRDEIQHLSWAQIDFLDSCIVLPDRQVPIPEDLASYLADLREGRNRCSEVVVLSDRDKKPLTPQSISRNETASLLGVSRSTAYNRLKLMVKRGRLTQIGARYYLKETVVPPEQQEAVILEYLDREGFAFRQDIARLLKIDARQVRPILQKMISAGQIVQEKQKYLLAEQKAHA